MGVKTKLVIKKIHLKMVKKEVKKIIKNKIQNRQKVREPKELWEGNPKIIGNWELESKNTNYRHIQIISDTLEFDKYGNVKSNYEIAASSGYSKKDAILTKAKRRHVEVWYDCSRWGHCVSDLEDNVFNFENRCYEYLPNKDKLIASILGNIVMYKRIKK